MPGDRQLMRQRYQNVPSLLAARHAMLDSPQKLFEASMSLINDVLEELTKLDVKTIPIEWEGEPEDEAAE